MKSQDIILLLKLLECKEKPAINRLAVSIELSASETHAAIKRNVKAKLMSEITGLPVKSSLEEFIIYGFKYVFPAEISVNDTGVLTFLNATSLKNKFAISELEYVWPFVDADDYGVSVKPLYKTVPKLALKDEKMHQYLALLDVIRIGNIREEKAAKELLIKLIRE